MKAINKTRAVVIALLGIFILGFTPPALCKDEYPTPVQLTATGNPNRQPLFELKVNNAETAEYLVMVKDENGELLFSEKLKGKNISRKYQLDTNLEEFNAVFNVRFEITMLNTRETFIYNVTRKSRVVQDIVVAKL